MKKMLGLAIVMALFVTSASVFAAPRTTKELLSPTGVTDLTLTLDGYVDIFKITATPAFGSDGRGGWILTGRSVTYTPMDYPVQGWVTKSADGLDYILGFNMYSQSITEGSMMVIFSAIVSKFQPLPGCWVGVANFVRPADGFEAEIGCTFVRGFLVPGKANAGGKSIAKP